MNPEFNIDKFNIISDEEYYYFFRCLEDGDIKDLKEGKIELEDNGHISKLRTDRERWVEEHQKEAKYSEDSKVSLEEMFLHIKMNYSKETNCISLTSNANVARTYESMFSKDFAMIKVPKKELNEKCFNAGQYMLSEIEKRVDEVIESENIREDILDDLKKVDEATNSDTLKELIKTKYVSREKIHSKQAKMRKGIVYKSPHTRISSWNALDEKQTLEKNKIIAKLTILENKKVMKPIIPNSNNNNFLIQTVGGAFASSEQIYYGEIDGEKIQNVSKEIIDIFGLIQQIDDIDKNIINDLEKEIIDFINDGKRIETNNENNNFSVKNDISIEEMYELTDGKVEYGNANSIIKNMFYLSRSQNNARKMAEIIENITKNNAKYEDIIKYIKENGFVVEPEVISKLSNKGLKISESVSLNLKENEKILAKEICDLSDEEQDQIIRDGGISNVNDIITRSFSKLQNDEEIPKNRYYAEAMISLYNWSNIGIERISPEERENLLNKIEERDCIEIYRKLEQQGIERNEIPRAFFNIITRNIDYNELSSENLEELNQELSIERIERFLGYYDVPNTQMQLRPYQQRAHENVDEIFEKERFASVILPTGGGKSYVSIAQLMENPDRKMLYLAPQNEILEQMKSIIIEQVQKNGEKN